MYLEPQTTIYKWLFQLDDSESLHRKWLFHQTSILNLLFGVPGCDIFTYKLLEGLVFDLCLHNTVGIWSDDSDMAAVFDNSSGGLHGEGAPAGIFAARS